MPTPIIIPPTLTETAAHAARANHAVDAAQASANRSAAAAANSVPNLRAVVKSNAELLANALARIQALEARIVHLEARNA